ncbi:DgyrCDS6097 [Dimorphilus gyrociliatus]|uniref:DgyrCDS6097 n=1 Tax=Dimorphilus gyrociliatus TaxID=2664684 RepID=A0A7I8VMS4_9ANNE|nr:DgyrCDS6097 [Dimorphilus gyrociliatus]
MKQARYGRMEDSKCPIGSDGIGCWADVMPILASRCSGRGSCTAIPTDQMVEFKKNNTKGNQKCSPLQLQDNLRVEYECQQVVLPSKSAACVIDDKRFGNISSHHSRLSGCGFDTNPILIQPPTDKHEITMKLIYFGRSQNNLLGFTKDLNSGELKSIHDSSSILLEKVKSRIEISFTESVKKGHLKDVNFLVSFQVVKDCEPIRVDDDQLVTRVGSTLIIRCKTTDQEWKIECIRSTWFGDRGECAKSEASASKGFNGIPYEVSIAIIIGVALIIGVIVLISGLLCLQWQRQKNLRAQQAIYASTKATSNDYPENLYATIADCPNCRQEKNHQRHL